MSLSKRGFSLVGIAIVALVFCTGIFLYLENKNLVQFEPSSGYAKLCGNGKIDTGEECDSLKQFILSSCPAGYTGLGTYCDPNTCKKVTLCKPPAPASCQCNLKLTNSLYTNPSLSTAQRNQILNACIACASSSIANCVATGTVNTPITSTAPVKPGFTANPLNQLMHIFNPQTKTSYLCSSK